MALSAGTRLGPYEILAPIGAGGMGEVYRAKDTKLGRDVALKVLPEEFFEEKERITRFEQEAKSLAAVSHPHIAALYSFEEISGRHLLVMELAEGQTLAERLLKGPLPLDQLLRASIEIASALDAAHRVGIVHRDLKPGNVMLTRSGVKLLDFGLAKALTSEGPVEGLTSAPTAARDVTREGEILGTLSYMAPEQLERKKVDLRTDIFALGATLYEMATGRKAFFGTSQASLISAILSADPPSISTLQPMTPPALDRVVRTCLAKDPDERWQSAHDIGSELEWIAEVGSQAGMTVPGISRDRRRERLAWFVAATLSVALVASLFLGLRRSREAPKAIRFSIASPEKAEFYRHPASNSLALSPDGSSLAFVAVTGGNAVTGGKTSLWVRPFEALAAVRLNGTEDAIAPFWSPDGRSVGFFAQGKLQKIAVAGGPPQALCDSAFGNAATWGRDGTILFAEWEGGREGISRVSVDGGAITQAGSYDRARGERSQSWPVFLPDGRHFLYLSRAFDGPKESRSLWVGSLGSRQTHRIMAVDSRVAYCPPGYLLFSRDGALLAQPFDAGALRVTSDPTPISDNVWLHRATGNAAFSVSENGSVVYQAGPNPARLTWRDRSGRETGAVGAPALFGRPRISWDGSSIAVEVADSRIGNRDIWIYDARRGLAKRFTADPADTVSAVWSPGGDRIAFSSGGESALDIYVKSVKGIGSRQLLLKKKGVQLPLDWSPDGSRIVYEDFSPGRSAKKELWVLSLTEQTEGAPLLRTPFSASAARYSPDGGWIAFVSEESGRSEVYVVPAGGQGGIRRVSASGGSLPRWRRDGKELFYLAVNGDLLAVPTRTSGGFEAGSPRVLFTANPPPDDYDVAPDGSRFLFQERAPGRDVPLTVVLNWTSELKK